MRVPRHVNVALQTFNAWQHRKVVDENVKASDIQNAYTTLWKDPDRDDFTPHKITMTSGAWSAGVEATSASKGLL